MKRYSDNPLQVRLHLTQEHKLNEMIKDETYCRSRGIYSKSDVITNTINNALKEWDYTRLGTQ
jgi:hypothetical protein